MRALSGTGVFAIGGSLLVIAYFLALGSSGVGSQDLRGVLVALPLVAGLALAGLGIWRILHSELPYPPRKE